METCPTEDPAIPFTPYKSNFYPEARAAAQDAFEMGWTEIKAAAASYDVQLARNLLAKLIVDAALQGERDSERLKAYALDYPRKSVNHYRFSGVMGLCRLRRTSQA